MSLVALLKGKGPSGYGYGSTAEVVTQGISLKGRNILVTGSTSGLGLETVRVLAQRGARVAEIGAQADEGHGFEHPGGSDQPVVLYLDFCHSGRVRLPGVHRVVVAAEVLTRECRS